jgi:hypothetical protein
MVSWCHSFGGWPNTLTTSGAKIAIRIITAMITPFRDGRVDEVGHLDHVERAGRLVLDGHAHVPRRGLNAVGGDRPERVRRLAV